MPIINAVGVGLARFAGFSHNSQTKPSSCGTANATRGGSDNIASPFYAPAEGKAPSPCPLFSADGVAPAGAAVRPVAAAAVAAVRAAGELPPAAAVAVAEEPARFAKPLVEVTAACALQ